MKSREMLERTSRKTYQISTRNLGKCQNQQEVKLTILQMKSREMLKKQVEKLTKFPNEIQENVRINKK